MKFIVMTSFMLLMSVSALGVDWSELTDGSCRHIRSNGTAWTRRARQICSKEPIDGSPWAIRTKPTCGSATNDS